MRKIYTLPALTIAWRETSVGVVIDDDAEFREWLSRVKRRESVDPFRFHWADHPNSPSYNLCGDFYSHHTRHGIFVNVDLGLDDYYIVVRYSLNKFCSMFSYATRPSTLGLCVTVKV